MRIANTKLGLCLVLWLCFILLAIAGTGSLWQLNQTPSAEHFNGISAPNMDFAIGVGNNGAIVHFVNGDNGTLVPSGTSNNLFDVYASSPNLAVATGRDTVRLWNGSAWNEIRSSGDNSLYTGTWITPEEDVLVYGAFFGGVAPAFVCPFHIGDTQPRFCRQLGGAFLTACGNSDDIKLLSGDGDIYHVNNSLVDVNGFDPIYNHPSDLGLTAAWVPEVVCLPGPIPPQDIFAIRNHNEIWRFNGIAWVNMNAAILPGQTLTWLDGNGPNNIVAVGFTPKVGGGNDGVVWLFNGFEWTQDTNLPANTPGLTDVAANLRFQDDIFFSSFENGNANRRAEPGVQVNILAAAENGTYISSAAFFPQSAADLTLEKRLLTPEPIMIGDRVVYEIVVQNLGPATAQNVKLSDSNYADNMDYVSDSCAMSSLGGGHPLWEYRVKLYPQLAVNEVISCTIEFDVVSLGLGKLVNHARAGEVEGSDPNYRNNLDDVRTVIQP